MSSFMKGSQNGAKTADGNILSVGTNLAPNGGIRTQIKRANRLIEPNHLKGNARILYGS